MKFARFTRALTVVLSVSTILFFFPIVGHAEMRIEQLGGDVYGDFVVGPAKTELTLKQGESATVDLIVTNRTGEEKKFTIEIEDIAGSKTTDQVVTLLGNERGPYSLKDYVHPESMSFVLKSGERAWLPVKVSIPTDAEAGGKYGSVIISTSGLHDAKESGAVLVSRIGALFFVTVPGATHEQGTFKDFYLSDKNTIRNTGTVPFSILYQNTGSVHLNPSGIITITNIFGQQVAVIEINPWFALPDSMRLREVEWSPSFLMGKYTASLKLNRGYDNRTDTAELTFYVIPWIWVGCIALGLFIIFFILRLILSRFEIRRKA